MSSVLIIKCKLCGLPLTNKLTELTDNECLNETDNEDFIPKGYFILSDGDYFTNTEGKIIINLNDLINTKNHSNCKRLNGCCGLDGLDGFNTVCNNGHEIGTQKSDCWMPHCIIFENELIDIEKSF